MHTKYIDIAENVNTEFILKYQLYCEMRTFFLLNKLLGFSKEEVKAVKKVYRGIVEGNIIRLETQAGLPVGTQILVILKTLYKDEQEEIKARQLRFLDRGFYLGKKLYSMREDLYVR